MSMYKNLPITPSMAVPGTSLAWWILSLGRYVAGRREELGLSVAGAAELSGLAVSEWCALEEGWVPEDHDSICAVAGTLRVRWTELEAVASIVRIVQQSAPQS